MSLFFACKEKAALRQEAWHERKEARLHARAVNAAMTGNPRRAARLEARAQRQHQRAEFAHMKADAAHHGSFGFGLGCKPMCGPRVTVVHCYDSPQPATYPTGTIPPPPTGYPTGTAAPPMPSKQAPYPTQPPAAYPQQPAGYPHPPPVYPAEPPKYPGYPAEAPPPYTAGYPAENTYPYPQK